MRPTGDQGNFTVATEHGRRQSPRGRDGPGQGRRTAELLEHLRLGRRTRHAGAKLEIQQTAPGRYVGEFASDQAGSYFLTLLPGGGHAPVRTGVNVPYSAEFRDRETNIELLERLGRTRAQGGQGRRTDHGPGGRRPDRPAAERQLVSPRSGPRHQQSRHLAAAGVSVLVRVLCRRLRASRQYRDRLDPTHLAEGDRDDLCAAKPSRSSTSGWNGCDSANNSWKVRSTNVARPLASNPRTRTTSIRACWIGSAAAPPSPQRKPDAAEAARPGHGRTRRLHVAPAAGQKTGLERQARRPARRCPVTRSVRSRLTDPGPGTRSETRPAAICLSTRIPCQGEP